MTHEMSVTAMAAEVQKRMIERRLELSRHDKEWTALSFKVTILEALKTAFPTSSSAAEDHYAAVRTFEVKRKILNDLTWELKGWEKVYDLIKDVLAAATLSNVENL